MDKARVVVVGGGAADQESDYLLISRQEINSLHDLVGRRVGISQPGDTSDTVSRLILTRSGIDTSKVRFLQIGGTNARMAGLLAGQLDAGIAHAAEGLNAAEKGGLKVLFKVAAAVPNYLQNGLLATDAWLAKHPTLAQIVVDTYIDANRWAHDNKDAYIALSKVRVPGLLDPVRSRAWDIYKEIGKFALNGGLLPKQIQNAAAIEKEVGNIKGEIPDLSLWVNDSFVKDYLARNGTR